MKKYVGFIMLFALTLVLVACGDGKDDMVPVPKTDGVNELEKNEEENVLEQESLPLADEMNDGELLSATVALNDREGNSIGTAELTEEENGVKVKVNATGLPEGPHGFHFHEAGKCEAPDFEAAGGHFNPTGASHGLDHEEGPHAGDLPNLEVGADGAVHEEFVAKQVTLKKGEQNSLLREGGTALVIHAGPDDGVSQPSGDSGDRIACGTVEERTE
ncbi:superoxide dismutase family protein [Sporosarcina sp. HYO08]|uniref:superoxide dismutase family protein n=1 Tax=Sporosarcina sp. HYO08 TaxID=1759557 RepID=UPI0007991C99|nr:superoxide dismutase family protein [Sporosarcina sp. HYO08]KXH84042.1 superoxide dismutase [Sporosarcina sp. HYO08]